MKATLEFNLPEESEEHEMALNAINFKLVISDTLETIKRKMDSEDSAALEEIKNEIWENINVYSLQKFF